LSAIWISGTLLEPVETIGSKVVVSTCDTTKFVETPKREFTYSGSMISIKLESHDGGKKEKVVLDGFDDEKLEGSNGFTSCPTIVGVSTFFSMVSSVLVSSEFFLSF
jgi:hypothetical protein